jgi:hypothetical protein
VVVAHAEQRHPGDHSGRERAARASPQARIGRRSPAGVRPERQPPTARRPVRHRPGTNSTAASPLDTTSSPAATRHPFKSPTSTSGCASHRRGPRTWRRWPPVQQRGTNDGTCRRTTADTAGLRRAHVAHGPTAAPPARDRGSRGRRFESCQTIAARRSCWPPSAVPPDRRKRSERAEPRQPAPTSAVPTEEYPNGVCG